MRKNSEYVGTPIYNLWSAMKKRCYSPSAANYKRYGGNGVVMCDEWKYGFKSFYDWCIANGWEQGMQIDKDIKAKELGIPSLLYSPERCQFVSSKVNNNARSNNRIIIYNGISKTLQQWAEYLGIKHTIIRHRISRNWSIQRMLTTMPNKYEKRK